MKCIQKILSVFLLILCIAMLAVPAAASAYAEHEGLQITVQMDNEQYNQGDAITATITVTNTNTHIVTVVNLEQLIPEGYVLAEGSVASTQNVEMQPGQTIELQVTFVGQSSETEQSEDGGSFFDKLLYGETWGIPNLLLAVVALIVFGIYMWLT